MRNAVHHFVVLAFHAKRKQVAHFLIGQTVEDVDHLVQGFLIRDGLLAEQQHAVVSAARGGVSIAVGILEHVLGMKHCFRLHHLALERGDIGARVEVHASLALDKIALIIGALADGELRMDRAHGVQLAADIQRLHILVGQFGLDHLAVLIAPVTELIDVSQAYRQVRTMSYIVQTGEKHLYWYRELFQDDVLYNYEYSIYTETGLRNNIMAGNERTVREMLVELYRRNLRSSVQSDHVVRFFACDLYRLVNHLDADESHEKGEALDKLKVRLDEVLEDPKQFDYYFGAAMAYCLELCEQYKNRRGNAGDDVLQRINDYVDAHYTDPNMSISGMADDLSLSAKYLSTLFKEQTGEKLSSYIERKRIEHASQLLEETEMSINDIALASGYALTHTFRVAFKRVQGVAPLDWKKSHKG